MSENNNEVRTVICPRCKYDYAEIHDLVFADTSIKIGETIRCPRCQKNKEENQC